MARTPTTQIPLGFKAPDFSLPNGNGNISSLKEIKGVKATVVMFICNHCPFVVHVAEELSRLAKDYQSKGIGFVAINSNDVENYPDDSPEKMVQFAKDYGFTFPYLFDESQDIAKAYDAACTPDLSVFDSELNCIYRGQLDDSRPGNDEPVNGHSMRKVLDYILDGKDLDFDQKPSLGCNIKWK